MQILEHFSLKLLNSFGFDAKADALVRVHLLEELVEAIAWAKSKKLPWNVIGGGSNLVIYDDLPGLTLQILICGKELVQETDSHYFIDVGAGENWHAFVAWTIDQHLPGLENLALIPGTCGAAPIQNIGAYGCEVNALIDSVEVFDTEQSSNEQAFTRMRKEDCRFAYRHSIFKEYPKRWIVTRVRFALPKRWLANLSYLELANSFENSPKPSAKQIFEAVCSIRQRKLPDPALIGNAGSFFHNPIVSHATYLALKERFPQLVAYPNLPDTSTYKIAAGWLIDQCGLKGFRQGSVGVYEKQALVLVNHGGGNGRELLALAQMIKEKIHAVYGVDLTQEPVNLPE